MGISVYQLQARMTPTSRTSVQFLCFLITALTMCSLAGAAVQTSAEASSHTERGVHQDISTAVSLAMGLLGTRAIAQMTERRSAHEGLTRKLHIQLLWL